MSYTPKYPHLQVNFSKHFLPLLCQFWASILKEWYCPIKVCKLLFSYLCTI